MHKLSQAINSQLSNHLLLGQQQLPVQISHMHLMRKHLGVFQCLNLELPLHHLHLHMVHLGWLWWLWWLQWQWALLVVLRVYQGERQWCNKGQCDSHLNKHNYSMIVLCLQEIHINNNLNKSKKQKNLQK